MVPLSGALLGAMAMVAAGLGASSGPAGAQDGPPPELFLDISTGVSYEDFLDDAEDGFEATTRFGVGYFSSTHNQRLSFETGVTARADGDVHELTDPFASIAYALFNRNYEIGADLAYSRSDVEGDVLDDDFDAADLEAATGTREDIAYGVQLVTGRASPFGTDTRLRYSETTFSDGATDDDTTTQSATSTLRFTVDPRIEFTLTGFWQEEETEDAVNTTDTTTRLTFGANLAIDRVWTASVGLGYAELETVTTGGVAVEEGLEAAAILTRDMRNGELSFSADHVVTEDGGRSTVRVQRSIRTASGDTFDATLGQIFFEEGGSGSLAAVSYTRTVRSGSLSFGVNYQADLDDTDTLVHRTRANAALRQDITDFSGWALDGSLASVEYDNPASTDALRLDVGLAYLHALSNDWNLAARVEHQVLYEDGDLEDRSNILSLNLERRFSVRP